MKSTLLTQHDLDVICSIDPRDAVYWIVSFFGRVSFFWNHILLLILANANFLGFFLAAGHVINERHVPLPSSVSVSLTKTPTCQNLVVVSSKNTWILFKKKTNVSKCTLLWYPPHFRVVQFLPRTTHCCYFLQDRSARF